MASEVLISYQVSFHKEMFKITGWRWVWHWCLLLKWKVLFAIKNNEATYLSCCVQRKGTDNNKHLTGMTDHDLHFTAFQHRPMHLQCGYMSCIITSILPPSETDTFMGSKNVYGFENLYAISFLKKSCWL
jgi:hypothetical protein